MAKLVWAVTCSRIIHDSASNRISLIDTLDGVGLEKFPAVAPPIFIATVWQRDDAGTFVEVRARAYDPERTQLAETSIKLPMSPEHKRARINIVFNGLSIEKPGRYSFGLEIRKGRKWVEAARVPLDIEVPTPVLEKKAGPSKKK